MTDEIARRIDQLERESAAFQVGFLREVERMKARIEKLEREAEPRYDLDTLFDAMPHADPLGR